MKLKAKPIVKYDGSDKYVFINGVAKVPGTSMEITLKEFKELKEKVNEN